MSDQPQDKECAVVKPKAVGERVINGVFALMLLAAIVGLALLRQVPPAADLVVRTKLAYNGVAALGGMHLRTEYAEQDAQRLAEIDPDAQGIFGRAGHGWLAANGDAASLGVLAANDPSQLERMVRNDDVDGTVRTAITLALAAGEYDIDAVADADADKGSWVILGRSGMADQTDDYGRAVLTVAAYGDGAGHAFIDTLDGRPFADLSSVGVNGLREVHEPLLATGTGDPNTNLAGVLGRGAAAHPDADAALLLARWALDLDHDTVAAWDVLASHSPNPVEAESAGMIRDYLNDDLDIDWLWHQCGCNHESGWQTHKAADQTVQWLLDTGRASLN